MPRWASAAAARNRLVVAEALDVLAVGRLAAAAERQVVAVALAGGGGLERLEHHIRDALRGEHVAAHHGSVVAGVQQRASWDAHLPK
jgi:hypothetical protein